MTLRVFCSRTATLLALLAMALQMFWPLLARSKPSGPALLVEICTIEGVTHYVQLPAGKTPLEQRCEHQHEHCQFCVFGSERNATLASPEHHTSVVAPASAGPGNVVHIPAHARSLHPLAQPRAPPASPEK